jgi:3-methyladenine DNA glycosylase AlkD
LKELIDKLKQTEHGFKHIVEAGNELLKDSKIDHFKVAIDLLGEESYQARMLATHIFGQLAPTDHQALDKLETVIARDENWRVQEMLAKALDHYCGQIGYEKSLPEIKKWLSDDNPNVRRAVTEGLRIWTSRPFYKQNPGIAIQLISQNRGEESEYLRKSVGNALRDIGKKHRELINNEVAGWNLSVSKIAYTYKLISKK